jgi:methionyl-tRNA formyltransferase
MQMGVGMDDGPILNCIKMAIDPNDKKTDVKKKISDISINLILPFLDNPEKFPPIEQAGVPTFTKKITKEMLVADFNNPAMMHNLVRAYPVRARYAGVDLKITETRLNDDGELEVLRVHPSGKKEMDFKSFLNGHRGDWE